MLARFFYAIFIPIANRSFHEITLSPFCPLFSSNKRNGLAVKGKQVSEYLIVQSKNK